MMPVSAARVGLIHNRGFRFLLVGHFRSALAPMTQRALVLIWTYALTGRGAVVGLVGLAEALALVAVAPVAGVFADRWSRSRTMAGVVLVQALLMLPLLMVHDSAGLLVMLGVTLVVNAASQFYGPAAAAALPGIVGQELVGHANSLLQTAFGLVLVLAPGLAAAGFAALGPHGLVVGLMAVYLVSAPFLALVPAPAAAPGTRSRTVLGDLGGGFRYVVRSQLLLGLVAVNLVAAFGSSALGVLDVVFATRGLHQRPETAGVLLTATGLGQLVGGGVFWVLLQRLPLRRRYHLLLGVGVVAWGLLVLAYASTPTLVLASAVLFAIGAVGLVVGVSFVTLVQLASDNVYRGRVMSLVTSGASAAAILSTSAGGALTDVLGVRQVIAVIAAILLAAGVMALLVIRETQDRSGVPVEAEIPAGQVGARTGAT